MFQSTDVHQKVKQVILVNLRESLKRSPLKGLSLAHRQRVFTTSVARGLSGELPYLDVQSVRLSLSGDGSLDINLLLDKCPYTISYSAEELGAALFTKGNL